MKLALVQMDVKLGAPDENLARAKELICEANKGKPDVILLPETWNVGRKRNARYGGDRRAGEGAEREYRGGQRGEREERQGIQHLRNL